MNGKYALVTGGSRGIGRAIALKLAKQGAKIAVHYHSNEQAARETLSESGDGGGFIVQADVRRPSDIERMFTEVRERFGRLDIFVACARPELPTFYESPLAMRVDQWQSALESQAQAFLSGVQQAAGLMNDRGRIIAISYSPGGRTGSWQRWAAMGPAKAALDSLCRYFAVALAPRGITVNIVSPGVIFGEPDALRGGVLRCLPHPVQQQIRDWHESGWTPMKRIGTPEDVADSVMLLCMREAGFITGQTLHVDGGASIMDPVLPLTLQHA